MVDLLRRLIKKCRDEGTTTAVNESISYLKYALPHTVGKMGCYSNYYYWNKIIYLNNKRWKYNAVANPFKIIWVNPDEITHITGRKPFPGRFQWIHSGLIKSGDWDVHNELFENKLIYKAIKKRYTDNVPWDETEFVNQIKGEISEGIVNWRGVRTNHDIDKECDDVDRLFQDIYSNGYKTSEELLTSGVLNERESDLPDRYLKYDEVAIDIGRNGQFLFVDGRHRLSIAKVLNLDKIPVRVVARHKDWQEIREDAFQTKTLCSEIHDHPDLQDLI